MPQRKRKQCSEAEVEGGSEDDSPVEDGPQSKLDQRRAKNREAARRTRERRAQTIKDLTAARESLSAANLRLEEEGAALREEVAFWESRSKELAEHILKLASSNDALSAENMLLRRAVLSGAGLLEDAEAAEAEDDGGAGAVAITPRAQPALGGAAAGSGGEREVTPVRRRQQADESASSSSHDVPLGALAAPSRGHGVRGKRARFADDAVLERAAAPVVPATAEDLRRSLLTQLMPPAPAAPPAALVMQPSTPAVAATSAGAAMAWLGGITPDYAAAAGGASHVGLAPSPQQAADVKRAPIEQQQQQPSDPPTITYSDLLHMLGGGGLNPVQLQPLPLQHVPGPAAAPAALGPRALPAGVGLSEHAASAAGAEVVAYVIPATTAEGVRCAPQQADGRGQLAEQIISERLHISSIWRDQQAGGDGGAAATGEAAAAADMGSRAATPLLPVLTPAPSLERLGSTVTMSHTLGDLLAAYQAEPNNSNQQVHGGLAEAAAAGTTVRGMTPPADAMATVQQQAAAAPQLFTAKPSSSAANSGYGESDGRTMADAMHMLVKE